MISLLTSRGLSDCVVTVTRKVSDNAPDTGHQFGRVGLVAHGAEGEVLAVIRRAVRGLRFGLECTLDGLDQEGLVEELTEFFALFDAEGFASRKSRSGTRSVHFWCHGPER